MRSSTRFSVLITVFILSFFLTACGGGAASNTGGGGGGSDPVKTTKDFFAAAFGGTDVSGYLCKANDASAKAIAKSFEGMKTSLTASGAKITTDKMTFEAGPVNGDTTTVKVGGKMTVTMSGTSTDSDFPSSPITLKKEGDAWKICG